MLRTRLGVELPPDVVALFEYTNGAWLDRNTPLDVFVPNWGRFPAISRHMFSVTWEIDEEGVNGPGFGDLPGRDYMLNVPIISFESGDQLSVMWGSEMSRVLRLRRERIQRRAGGYPLL